MPRGKWRNFWKKSFWTLGCPYFRGCTRPAPKLIFCSHLHIYEGRRVFTSSEAPSRTYGLRYNTSPFWSNFGGPITNDVSRVGCWPNSDQRKGGCVDLVLTRRGSKILRVSSLSQTQLRLLVVAWIWDHFGKDPYHPQQGSDEIYWLRQ